MLPLTVLQNLEASFCPEILIYDMKAFKEYIRFKNRIEGLDPMTRLYGGIQVGTSARDESLLLIKGKYRYIWSKRHTMFTQVEALSYSKRVAKEDTKILFFSSNSEMIRFLNRVNHSFISAVNWNNEENQRVLEPLNCELWMSNEELSRL